MTIMSFIFLIIFKPFLSLKIKFYRHPPGLIFSPIRTTLVQ